MKDVTLPPAPATPGPDATEAEVVEHIRACCAHEGVSVADLHDRMRELMHAWEVYEHEEYEDDPDELPWPGPRRFHGPDDVTEADVHAYFRETLAMPRTPSWEDEVALQVEGVVETSGHSLGRFAWLEQQLTALGVDVPRLLAEDLRQQHERHAAAEAEQEKYQLALAARLAAMSSTERADWDREQARLDEALPHAREMRMMHLRPWGPDDPKARLANTTLAMIDPKLLAVSRREDGA